MLEDPVPALPGAYSESSAAALPPGLLPLEGARTLLRYKTYFRTEAVHSGELLKMALSLRYQVYCLERHYEDATRYPDRLETDLFDAQSVHGLLFYRPSDAAIGTTRLILPGDSTAPLPFHTMLAKAGMAGEFPRGRTAEISRFAVSRAFRPDKNERSQLPCLGLAQLLLRLSRTHGVTHWAALMPPALLRMLAMMGIEFMPLGPVVDYHGLRQPSGCEVARMLDRLYRRYPAHWQIVTDGGRLA